MLEAFLAGGLSLVGGWAGAYFGSYLKKKGENLATHEDIDKLVDQVRVVTQTTKEIEAKISDEVWDRQKRWELKREVLFQAAKAVAGAEHALISLHSVTQVEINQNNIIWVQAKNDRMNGWIAAHSVLEEASLLVATVCSRKAALAFRDYANFLGRIAQPIAEKDDPEIYMKSRTEHSKKHLALQEIIREELGVDGTPAQAGSST
jgi:hypothetical protein